MAWQYIFGRRVAQGETVTAVKTRAGFLDRPVLAVLGVSLVLVVAMFGAMLAGIW